MDSAEHNKIVNFIWGIADDVLRDLYVRGKYRDVILPIVVLRRFDAVLEKTKQEVLDRKKMLDESKIVEQDEPLRAAAGQAFYNISPFTPLGKRSRFSSSGGLDTCRRLVTEPNTGNRPAWRETIEAVWKRS